PGPRGGERGVFAGGLERHKHGGTIPVGDVQPLVRDERCVNSVLAAEAGAGDGSARGARCVRFAHYNAAMFYPFEVMFDLMHRGGPVMWLLLALNLLSVTLIVERCLFWVRTNSPARLSRLAQINRLLRKGDTGGARVLAGS